MITVLICDDDIEFIKLEKETIENAAMRYEQEVWVESYESGAELLDSLEKKEETKLCIVLLDIDMPEMDGYEVARIINERFEKLITIFVSSREDLVFQAFEYKPFRFVRKSHLLIDLRHALRKAFEVLERRMEKETVVVCMGEKILLAHSELAYLIKESRKVKLFLEKGKILEVRASMKGMLETLNDNKLVLINSGCAVNADHVASYTKDTVILKNGVKLPISRDRAKEVKIQIERNWRK